MSELINTPVVDTIVDTVYVLKTATEVVSKFDIYQWVKLILPIVPTVVVAWFSYQQAVKLFDKSVSKERFMKNFDTRISILLSKLDDFEKNIIEIDVQFKEFVIAVTQNPKDDVLDRSIHLIITVSRIKELYKYFCSFYNELNDKALYDSFSYLQEYFSSLGRLSKYHANFLVKDGLINTKDLPHEFYHEFCNLKLAEEMNREEWEDLYLQLSNKMYLSNKKYIEIFDTHLSRMPIKILRFITNAPHK